MNDLEFRQRALANPRDEDPALEAAAAASPERRRFLDELRVCESRIEGALRVTPPGELAARLLDPEALAARAPLRGAASARPLWRRLLPFAASLLLAVGLGVGWWYESGPRQLEREIFAHIYREANFLQADDQVELPQVNRHMAAIGGELRYTPEVARVKVKGAEDCWVAQSNTVHLVVKGDKGAVTVLMIDNAPVAREFNIADERFAGLVTPTPGGNLVVVGEKHEPVGRVKSAFEGSLHWEY